MKFNWKRGILAGALLWVLIFFEVSVLMFGFGMSDPTSSIAHQILIILFVAFSCWVYFRGKKVEREISDGLMLGLTFVITGIILDAVITVPLFIKSYSFFANGLLWAGYIEGVVICALYSMFEKKRNRKRKA